VTKKKTATIVLFAIAPSGCFTTGAESPASPESGAPAVDATVTSDASIGPTPASPAEKAACVANPASCLMGTAAATRFSVPPAQMKAKLYRVFPVGVEQPIETQLVDDAGAWTFGGSPDAGLAAWAHYYVQMEADFNVDGGAPSAIAALAGPLGVPSTGAPVGVDVPPVQLNVLESRAPGGSMQLQWVLAHVFDPATGDEIVGSATVSIAVGGSSQTIPWSAAADGGVNGYFRQFAAPPPAQASYTVSVSALQFGQAPVTFQLVADVPAFDGAIVAPDGGAPVPAGKPLSVTWAAEPQADYEVVQIFTSSGLASVYVSPQPDPPDQTTETIVPGLDAGSYLLNVSYSKTNCAATADGCVQANTVSAGSFIAQ
jgi:hypothetical protein